MHGLLCLKLIEPYFVPMTFDEFKEKIDTSLVIMKRHKLYALLGLLFLIRAAPQLDEPIDYYLTADLNFTGTYLALKNATTNLAIVGGIYMIKISVFDLYTKTSFAVFNTLMIISSVMLFLVTNETLIIFTNIRTGLAFASPALMSFALEVIKLTMYNIYITFCPKNIEATFAAFFFFIDDGGKLLGTMLQNILIYALNISRDNDDFSGIFSLLISNILVYFLVYLFLCFWKVPTEKEMEESVTYDNEDIRELRITDQEYAQFGSLLNKREADHVV